MFKLILKTIAIIVDIIILVIEIIENLHKQQNPREWSHGVFIVRVQINTIALKLMLL